MVMCLVVSATWILAVNAVNVRVVSLDMSLAPISEMLFIDMDVFTAWPVSILSMHIMSDLIPILQN